jgi:hypothetical protein
MPPVPRGIFELEGNDLRRLLLITIALLLVGTAAFGQVRATVENLSGKVEVRPQGGGWSAAQEGQRIARGSTISTGFNSRATLRLADSLLEVEPLTRMTLEDLVETSDTVSTDVFVRVGRTRANVRTAEGVRSNFRMRSPITTASVRGTEFRFDTRRTEVTEGTVTVANFLGRETNVGQGGAAVVQEFGSIEDVRDTFLGQSTVDTTPGNDEGDDGTDNQQAKNAIVVITIDWD